MAEMKTFALMLMFPAAALAQSKAQTGDLQADRPDQTETPSLVPVKHFQMETGFAFEFNENERNFSHPSALLKYGLMDNLELRVIVEAKTFKIEDESGEQGCSGMAPAEIGMKVKLVEEKKGRPAVSLIGHAGIPWAATKRFRSEYVPFNFRFALQHTLTSWLSLGYNGGMEWDGERAEPTFIYTVATGFSITSQVGAFAEAYGFKPQQSPGAHALDAGFTYLPKPNLLFDISAGWSMTHGSCFIGCGFSFRLPD